MNRLRDTFGSPLAMLLFFGTTILGLAIDLITKDIAASKLSEGDTVRLIPSLLDLTYTRNHGAVFGLGQGHRLFFIFVSVLAIGFLSYLFALSARRRWYQFLLGLLLAGVLGNMYDRILFGYVRDMILGLPGIYWPRWIAQFLPIDLQSRSVFPWVFNVADSMLCAGVFLMIIYNLFEPDRRRIEPGPDVSADEPSAVAQHVRR